MQIDPVKDSLCFKLYLASRMMTGLYKPFLESMGLTFPQSLIMGCLWEQDKQTIKSLGQQLHLDSGTLTPLVKRLEAAGLLIREKSLQDERSNFIQLTTDGKRLKQKGLQAHQQFYETLQLDEKSIDSLKGIIDKWIEKQTTNE
jgi:MarR family transcriptional regulator, organic hydroperoxide resistance regulator